jgi:hypothetical protein
VNFDIPFNPSRLEQRIGRVNRYGQELTPEIYQLSPAGNGSAYARDLGFLLDKVRQRSTPWPPDAPHPGERAARGGYRAGADRAAALFNADSPVHRVTAVVVGDLPDLVLAGADARRELAALWNGDGTSLRTRLLTAMEHKAGTRQEKVIDALHKRRDTDIARAREIVAAFRVNLRESRDRLDREIRGEEEKLFPDDQQRQRRRDLASMTDRLDSVEEEQREVAAIGARTPASGRT